MAALPPTGVNALKAFSFPEIRIQTVGGVLLLTVFYTLFLDEGRRILLFRGLFLYKFYT